jgi:hypothetical protein
MIPLLVALMVLVPLLLGAGAVSLLVHLLRAETRQARG